MTEKQKSAQKSRGHKESKGTARGARPVRLTDLQKILLVNGGMGHSRLRSNKSALRPAETKARRVNKFPAALRTEQKTS